jgi:hypothetical protein
MLFVRNGQLSYDVGWVGYVRSDSRVVDGRWHHVAVTFEDRTDAATVYVDGRRDGRRELRLAPDPEEHVLKLGFGPPRSLCPLHFDGLLDDLRIYKRVLGGPEVLALAGNRPAPPGEGPAERRRD